MNSSPIYTLDLGSSKVALLAATLDESGRLCAQEVGVAPNRGVTKGVITDLDLTREAVQEALQQIKSYGVPDEVYVNLGGTQLEGMNSQGFHPIVPAGRTITSADTLAVINHSRQVRPEPDREQVLAVSRDFKVDGQNGIVRPIGLSGSRLEVTTHIITAPITNMRNLQSVVEASGLRIADIIPNPVAAGQSFLTDDDRKSGVAVVDLGANTTTLSIYYHGGLAHSVVLPIGSGHVTNDLAKLLKMTPEEADQLKRKYGRAFGVKAEDESTVEVRQIGQTQPRHMHRRVLFEIIESRMGEIAKLVGQHLERSGMRGMLSGGLVLTGGGALLPGAPQLFGVALREPNARLGTPKLEGPAALRASGPEWSVAAGMAAVVLQGEGADIEPANGLDQWKERIRSFFIKV